MNFNLLQDRRIPLSEIEVGRAYVIYALNGGVGVAVRDDKEVIGYRLRRVKFGIVFLFTEWEWDQGPPHGTAIPLKLVDEAPPLDEADLIAWLEVQEQEHRAFTQAIFREVWNIIEIAQEEADSEHETKCVLCQRGVSRGVEHKGHGFRSKLGMLDTTCPISQAELDELERQLKEAVKMWVEKEPTGEMT